MWRLGAAALVLVSCASPRRNGQTTALVPPGDPGLRPFQIALEDMRLPSGMRVVLEADPSIPLVGVVEVVRGGSAADPTGREGLADLLLHVGERGQRSERDRAGVVTVTQTTAFDETVAVSVAPPEAVGELMRLTGARLADPLHGLDEADVDRERALAAARIREQIETGAQAALVTLMQRRLFPEGHPYRSALAGTPESLARIRLADVREAARLQYRPENVTLLVFGDFNPKTIAVETHLPATLIRTAASPGAAQASPRGPPEPRGPKLERTQAALVSPELWIGWSLPAAQVPAVHELVADWFESEVAHPASPGEKAADDSARYQKRQVDALALSASSSPHAFALLVSGMTSVLNSPMVAPLSAEDTDIIDMSAFTVSGRQGGMLLCRVRLRDGAHPEASLEHVLNQLYRMWYSPAYYGGRYAYDPRIADVLHEERALTTRFRVAVRMALAATNPLERARWTAQQVAQGGDPQVLEHSIEQVAETTEGWMEHFGYDWLTRSRARALYLEPSRGAAPRGAPSLGAVKNPPEPPAQPDANATAARPTVALPLAGGWRTLRLANGLEVVIVRRPEYPVVTVRLGLLHTEARVPGAIELAEQVAAPDSKWHGFSADHAVARSEQIGPDAVTFEMHGGADTLPRLLAQLGDRVRSMAVRRDAVLQFRQLWLPLLARDDVRAETRADRAFWHALYPLRSYGQRPSFAELAGIDDAAAAKWVHEAYTPDRAVLAVVGDLDLDETQKLVERWMGEWKPIERPRKGRVRVFFNNETRLEEPPPPPPPAPKPALIIEDRPGAEVVELRLGCRLPDADRAARAHAYDLLAEVMIDRLREPGLLVDVDGHAETLRGGNAHLEVSGVLAARDLPAAMARLEKTFDMDAESLARARARLAARLGLRYANGQKIAREVLDARKRGWPLDTLAGYFEEVDKADPGELAAALAYCRDVRVLSLVGDRARIAAVVK
jgi:zinc protease